MRDVTVRGKLIPLPLLSNMCNITPTLLQAAAEAGELKGDISSGTHHNSVWATEEALWDYVATLNPGHSAYKRAVKIGKIGRCLVCRNIAPIANPGKPVCRNCWKETEPEMGEKNTKVADPKEAAVLIYETMLKRNGDGSGSGTRACQQST